ncbi:MAG: hypothetical protein JNM39_08655 [Bdellovibrionaceae bacterium]|nr:hypothetical protein [Pseudobdellovibrionaceae bacterium]
MSLGKAPFTAVELHFQICGAQGAVLSEKDLNGPSPQSAKESLTYGDSKGVKRRWAPREVLGLALKSLKLSPEGTGSEVLKSQTVYFLDVEDKSHHVNPYFFNSRNVILRVRENKGEYIVSIKNRVPITKTTVWKTGDSLARDAAVSKLFDLAGKSFDGTNDRSCEFDFIKSKLSMSCTSSAKYKKQANGDQIEQIVRMNGDLHVVSQSEKPLEIIMGKRTDFGEFLSQIIGTSNAIPLGEARPVGWAQRTFWKWRDGFEERVFENWSLLSGKAEIEELMSMNNSAGQNGLSGQTTPAKGKDFRLPNHGQPTQILEYSTRVSLSLPPSRNADDIEKEVGQTARMAWQGVATQLEEKGLILCDSPVSKTEFSAGRIK